MSTFLKSFTVVGISFLFVPQVFATEVFDRLTAEAECRTELKIDGDGGSKLFTRDDQGQIEQELQQSLLFNLRRCINDRRQAFAVQKQEEKIQMRADQHFWKAKDRIDSYQEKLKKGLERVSKQQSSLVQKNLTRITRQTATTKYESRTILRKNALRKEVEQQEVNEVKKITIQEARKKCMDVVSRKKAQCIRDVLLGKDATSETES